MSLVEPRERDRAEATRCDALSVAERAELRALLATHFEGVTEAQFESDLAEKNWVLRVRRGERLVGFSTLLAYSAPVAGREVNVIYSGDTLMAPEAWNSPTLARGWIALVKQVQATLPAGPCYWLLLSSGFRTYRFLPVFWREFWPRWDQATPSAAAELMTELARVKFGERYEAGVVRLAVPQRLRGELAEVPAQRREDAHVRFFLEQNPGHAEGDELVCLTELSDANLTPTGRRVVREAGL
jgi:hypothetical protein